VLGEGDCLLDLLSGQVKGNEVVRNKQHYILGTAEEGDVKGSEEGRRRTRGEVELRELARAIPGVPIVYVKRSVMILEELSGASEAIRRGEEKQKFKEGLGLANVRKRKRGQDDDDDGDEEVEDEVLRDLLREDDVQRPTARGLGRAKGPNPLSVKKKKKVNVMDAAEGGTSEEPKKKSTRRIRGKKKKAADGGDDAADGADAKARTSD
jgi:U3 small nucleolar RNA-associated protein 23